MEVASSPQYAIQSVKKAVAVLSCFLEPPHVFGVSEVARATGVNKNQAFRLLATLEEAGLVVRTGPQPAYRLGWRMVTLGQVAARGIGLREVARPVAARLAAMTAETVHLVAFDGTEAVCVDRWESPQMIRLSAEVGQVFPLHAGASPKAILAALPADQARRAVERFGFVHYTDKTICSWPELEAEIAGIRRVGYSLSRGDVDDGAESVGAAIFDGEGRVVGAISVAGPFYRFTARIEEFAHMVRNAAAEITAQFGGTLT
jgi:IclR family acetate operon transcriptional repressor